MTEGWNDRPGWDEEPPAQPAWSRQTAILIGAGALLVLALIGAVVLVLSGGGGEDGSTTAAVPTAPATASPTGPVPTAPPATGTSSSTVTPSTSPPALGDIPADRKDVGYLRTGQVLDGVTYLALDRIQFLTGAAAQAAAAKAGEEVTNDYYIVNSNAMLRTVRLDKNVKVIGSIGLNSFADPDNADNPPDAAPRTLDDLLGYLKAKGNADPTPFRLEYGTDGSVTAVTEQYVP